MAGPCWTRLILTPVWLSISLDFSLVIWKWQYNVQYIINFQVFLSKNSCVSLDNTHLFLLDRTNTGWYIYYHFNLHFLLLMKSKNSSSVVYEQHNNYRYSIILETECHLKWYVCFQHYLKDSSMTCFWHHIQRQEANEGCASPYF